VLFVHGLWSDPTTWTDMFNDLRANVDIRRNYQFWFYLYPTGQPFWTSAAQLREDLARVRQELDPQRQAWALDHMVLVGHSMGGLVSKLQTVDSGEDYWSAVSNQPFQVVKASPQTRQTLERTFFFGSNPAIRRVVTIGTPHRGSDFANKYTRFLGRSLIFLPEMLVNATKELYQDNPDIFRDKSFARSKTSIDSLAPQSPLLPVLLSGRQAPWVRYHNIVGVVGYNENPEAAAQGTDGIVAFASAHLDNVESELIVDSDHINVHRHPLAVLEVRRILLEHLGAQRRWQAPTLPPFRTTGFEQYPAMDAGPR
jgi:pimeloyl-ACP methyl ester carboxylesterase